MNALNIDRRRGIQHGCDSRGNWDGGSTGTIVLINDAGEICTINDGIRDAENLVMCEIDLARAGRGHVQNETSAVVGACRSKRTILNCHAERGNIVREVNLVSTPK